MDTQLNNSNWEIKTLGEVSEVVGGGTPKTGISEYWSEEIVWVTPKDLGQLKSVKIFDTVKHISKIGLEKSSAKLLPEGSVVMSSRAPIGYVAIAGVDLATNQGCRNFICGNNIFNKYLYYFLFANTELLNSLGGGATFKEISGTTLKGIKIPLPSLSEQKRIVEILDEKFAVIEKLRQVAQQQIIDAKELFESRVSEIFDNSDGEEQVLADVCDLKNGYAFKSGDYVKHSNTLNVRMSNIRPGGYFDAEHNQRFLPDTYAKKFASYLLQEGDLIIAMTDMAGKPKILAIPTLVSGLNGRAFLLNQRVGKLTDFSETVSVPFLRYFLSSSKTRDYLQSKGVKGVQINLSKSEIMNTPIKLPSMKVQSDYVIEIDNLSEKTQELVRVFQSKISDLEDLKKSYLKQAFAGKL